MYFTVMNTDAALRKALLQQTNHLFTWIIFIYQLQESTILYNMSSMQ